MGMIVGDIISKIEKYEKLKEQISVSDSERIHNNFNSPEDVLTFIKSKLTYEDIIDLQLLLYDKIEMLKKIKVAEDDE